MMANFLCVVVVVVVGCLGQESPKKADTLRAFERPVSVVPKATCSPTRQ